MDLLSNPAKKELIWLNEPVEWSFTNDSGITIAAAPDTDFFCDPALVNIKHSAPFLYKRMSGDFQITARTHVDMKVQYDASCLMMRLDSKNWIKLCLEFDGKSPGIVSVVTRNGSSDDCNHFLIEREEASLRITKVGEVISLLYSQDDTEWKLVRYFGFEAYGQFDLGVVAQSPMGIGTRVHFDYLDIVEPPTQKRF